MAARVALTAEATWRRHQPGGSCYASPGELMPIVHNLRSRAGHPSVAALQAGISLLTVLEAALQHRAVGGRTVIVRLMHRQKRRVDVVRQGGLANSGNPTASSAGWLVRVCRLQSRVREAQINVCCATLRRCDCLIELPR